MADMPLPCNAALRADSLRRAIATARREDTPYTHFILRDVLPEQNCASLRALEGEGRGDTSGRRAGSGGTRVFCSPAAQAAHPVLARIARLFQSAGIVSSLGGLCGKSFAGTFLRIEYCIDRDGFWLEPHTDIGEKQLTFLLYLSDDPQSDGWGTDILHPDGSLAQRLPATPNSALIFVPGSDTWHGFARRRIEGLRRTLIVNYVTDAWRSRDELCFPDAAVRATQAAGGKE